MQAAEVYFKGKLGNRKWEERIGALEKRQSWLLIQVCSAKEGFSECREVEIRNLLLGLL